MVHPVASIDVIVVAREYARVIRFFLRSNECLTKGCRDPPHLLPRALTEFPHIREHLIFSISKPLLGSLGVLDGFEPHAIAQARHTITLAFHCTDSCVFEVGSCMSYLGQDAVLQL